MNKNDLKKRGKCTAFDHITFKHFLVNLSEQNFTPKRNDRFSEQRMTTVNTARIRRMGEGNIFSLFTLAGRGGTLSEVCWWGGTPSKVWGGTPTQVWMVGRVPPTTKTRWGTPPPHPLDRAA